MRIRFGHKTKMFWERHIRYTKWNPRSIWSNTMYTIKQNMLRKWKNHKAESIKVWVYTKIGLLVPTSYLHSETIQTSLGTDHIHNDYVGFELSYTVYKFCSMKATGLRYKWCATSHLYVTHSDKIQIVKMVELRANAVINAFKFPHSDGLVMFKLRERVETLSTTSNPCFYEDAPIDDRVPVQRVVYDTSKIPIIGFNRYMKDETGLPLNQEYVRTQIIHRMNSMPYDVLLARMEGKPQMPGDPF